MANLTRIILPCFVDYEQICIWGFLPLMAAAIGFFFTHFFVQILEMAHILTPQHSIVYRNIDRESSREKGFAKVSKKEQLWDAILTFIGPAGWLNALLAGMILSRILPDPTIAAGQSQLYSNFPPMQQVALELAMLQLVDDFFQYWGHRIQHEIPYIWKKWHSKHHQMETPTTHSTGYIDDLDTTLQVGIPMILATILTKPLSISFTMYCFIRISENTINHCGYNHPLINFLWCKWLPLRAPIGHHDSHHKYSNHGKGAKNYAEFYIIWDWIFGSYRKAATSTKLHQQ